MKVVCNVGLGSDLKLLPYEYSDRVVHHGELKLEKVKKVMVGGVVYDENSVSHDYHIDLSIEDAEDLIWKLQTSIDNAKEAKEYQKILDLNIKDSLDVDELKSKLTPLSKYGNYTYSFNAIDDYICDKIGVWNYFDTNYYERSRRELNLNTKLEMINYYRKLITINGLLSKIDGWGEKNIMVMVFWKLK